MHPEVISPVPGACPKCGMALEPMIRDLSAVDAPNPEAMLAFSVWYASQGLGRIQTMPAFDAKSFETAVKDATA